MTPAAFAVQARQNPVNAALLARLPTLGLPDAWLVAGCLFQTVWNLRSGRPPGDAIRDYDVFYFDGADLSWEAEDRVIAQVAAATADLGVVVEVRNQARVHLWYGARFGPGYPALTCSRDGIDRFLVDCTRVALRIGDAEPYTPGSLADLHDGILRPNPLNLRGDRFLAKAESYRERWAWLQVREEG